MLVRSMRVLALGVSRASKLSRCLRLLDQEARDDRGPGLGQQLQLQLLLLLL